MIKGLKIYKKASEKVNFKIKKGKVFLTAMALTLSVAITGCGFGGNSSNKYTPNYSTSQSTINNNYNNNNNNNSSENIQIITNEKELQYGTYANTLVSLTNTEATNFINYLNGIDKTYHYSELFNTESALERYEANKFSNANVTHTYDFLKGGTKVDSGKLYDVVIKNNEKYLKENKMYLYEKLSNSEVKKIVAIVAETINGYIERHPNIDLKELSCTLGDLKILSKTAAVNAYISVDGCLVVSPNMIDALVTMNKDVDAYRNTIMHEAVHLIQRSCDDIEKVNPGKNIGISYKWTDFDVNPLDFNWLYEGSAEKCVTNDTGDRPLTYKTMITYIDSLNLTSITKENIHTTYNEELSLYKNLDALFEEFNCTTKEEKIELINMMMSINIIQTEPTDFTKKYQTVKGVTLGTEEYANVKCTIKAEAMRTLSKYFYRNLANSLTNKQISLEDIFFLITTFENDVNGHIKYTNSKYDGYNEEYARLYVEMQNEFFYAISLSTGYTQEEIIAKFNNYQYNLKDQKNDSLIDNYDLSWLGNNKKTYLEKFAKDKTQYGNVSIRYVYENYYAKGKVLTK